MLYELLRGPWYNSYEDIYPLLTKQLTSYDIRILIVVYILFVNFLGDQIFVEFIGFLSHENFWSFIIKYDST